MDFRVELEQQLGLKVTRYKYNLNKEELFREAISHDRGRIRADGPDDERKAYATKLGGSGPLVFYTDPSCTGRPVQDTCGVAWPEIEDTVWWKNDFQKFDPDRYEQLRANVIEYLNQRQPTLYVQDVFCGYDPAYAVPYRFVGEYATHADDNQIAQKMLTINRAARVFQIVEILKNRNGIVVCHELHELALRNQ